MHGTSRLAEIRTELMCVLGSIILLLAGNVRADDYDDTAEPPAPTNGSSNFPSLYDEIRDRSNRNKVGRTALDSAKQHVRNLPLNRVNASIKPPAGDLPIQNTLDDGFSARHSIDEFDTPATLFTGDQSRPWALSCYQWEAPATRHLPLLFEEPNLERLGYAYGCCDWAMCEEEPRRGQRLQTLVSGVHFFGRIPFLPYMAGVQPLTEPVYTLGVDRPGSPVPYRKYLPHWSARGALYEAGAIVGTAFIIP
jgi:hypothetical protein